MCLSLFAHFSHIWLLFIHVRSTDLQTCPNNFISSGNNGPCFRIKEHANTVCEAHQQCASTGYPGDPVTFLVGRHLPQAFQLFSTLNVTLWSSLHTLDEYNRLPDASWSDSDPRYFNSTFHAPDISLRLKLRPSDRIRGKRYWIAKVHLGSKSLYADTFFDTNGPKPEFAICELADTIPVGQILSLMPFHSCLTTFPRSDMPDDVGVPLPCYEFFDEESELICVFRCARDPNCRMAYYNGLWKKCVKILYVVSSLPNAVRHSGHRWQCHMKIL